MSNPMWCDFYDLVSEDPGFRPRWNNRPADDRVCNTLYFNDVLIFPSRMDKSSRVISDNILDSAGEVIKEARYLRGDNLQTFSYVTDYDAREFPSDSIKVNSIIYLGWLNPHYGHFITETLSRWWALSRMSPDILEKTFFYFDVHTDVSGILKKSFIKLALEVFRISEEKVLLGDNFYCAESFYVPEPSLILHNSINKRALSSIYDRYNSRYRDING